jgi:hypothetical protein
MRTPRWGILTYVKNVLCVRTRSSGNWKLETTKIMLRNTLDIILLASFANITGLLMTPLTDISEIIVRNNYFAILFARLMWNLTPVWIFSSLNCSQSHHLQLSSFFSNWKLETRDSSPSIVPPWRNNQHPQHKHSNIITKHVVQKSTRRNNLCLPTLSL